MQAASNNALFMVSEWISANWLELAPQKTQALLFTRRRLIENELSLYLGGHRIELKNITFGAHVDAAAKNVFQKVRAVGRLMPNLGGPSAGRRRLLTTVAHSTPLCGAPV